jgi:hypothetical protein
LSLAFLYSLQGFKSFFNVSVEIKHGIKDVPHDTFFVDNVSYPSRQNPESCRNFVQLSDFTSSIAEKGKRKIVFSSELLVGLGGVIANAYNFSTGILEDLMAIAKGAGFLGTTGGVVFGIKINDHIFLAPKVREADFGTVLGF